MNSCDGCRYLKYDTGAGQLVCTYEKLCMKREFYEDDYTEAEA